MQSRDYKNKVFYIFLLKNLVVSKKSSNFAAQFKNEHGIA